MVRQIRLGVNIDHVATLRNARGGIMPDPARAAFAVAKAGVSFIPSPIMAIILFSDCNFAIIFAFSAGNTSE